MVVRDAQCRRFCLTVLAAVWMIAQAGCQAVDFYSPSLHPPVPPQNEPPREMSMVSLPTYRVEPPDMVRIEVFNLVPRPPYRIEPFDVLQIRVLGTMKTEPIMGYFLVDGDGVVQLGAAYGEIRMAGLTLDEATAELTRYLRRMLQQPDAKVQLVRSNAVEQVSGLYLVQPDGTLNLRRYGMVHVSGKTVLEVQQAVEEQLALFFDAPRASVDVAGYHSAGYYVVMAGLLSGEKVLWFPITGNETVLDAVSRVEGLSEISSKTLWVARPAPQGAAGEEILPVDWAAVARGGLTATNYQLLPGDRLYVVDDGLVAANDALNTIANPIQKVLGLTNLGSITIKNTQSMGRNINRYRY